jgi:hypothetical protein
MSQEVATFDTQSVCTSPGWGVEVSLVHSSNENDGHGVKEKLAFFQYYSQDENDPWEEAEEFIKAHS